MKIYKTWILTLLIGLGLLSAPSLARGDSLVNFDKAAQPIPRAGGSLYNDPPDPEPRRLALYDKVTVVVLKTATATSEAETETEKEVEADMELKTAIDYKGNPLNKSGVNPTLKGTASLETEHSGSTGRLHRLQTRVSARVIEILPNRHMLIEGKDTVVINGEEQTITVSGYIAPEDIRPDGTVLSDNILDSMVTYTGRGTVTDAQKHGFLTSVLTFLWPF